MDNSDMKHNPLLSYRSADESLSIDLARKRDAVKFYNKYKDDLVERYCPACGSKRAKGLPAYNGTFPVVSCGSCTLVYVSKVPGQEALDEYYQNADSATLLNEFYARRNREAENIVSSSRLNKVLQLVDSLEKREIRVLEIGCGDGKLASEVIKRCKINQITVNYFGIEPNEEAASAAEKNGISVTRESVPKGVYETARLCGGDFDLVLCFELIEHVGSPVALMREIRESLRSGGTVIITTPNIEGFENVVLDYNVPRLLAHAICPPAHLQGFSRVSFGILAQRMRFDIETIKSKGSFDVPAAQYYYSQNKFDNYLQQLSIFQTNENKYSATYPQTLHDLQFIINICNASSTMSIILRKPET